MKKILGVLIVAVLSVVSVTPIAADAVDQRPNILLIITDDQRWDSLWAMPAAQGIGGVTFEQAHATTPLCCPSRASFLTGNYAHTTGVWRNKRPGGFANFDDSSTIATALHDAGYETGLIGIYLNGYNRENAAYVPPGWDKWWTITAHAKDYFGYSVSDNGAEKTYGFADEEYLTDVEVEESLEFVGSAARPFFLMWAPTAPHANAVPAPRHAHAFADLARWRPLSYDERDVSDKPEWVRELPPLSAEVSRATDRFRRNQYRTLLAVDEGVDRLLSALGEEASNTLVIFTSDHGYSWGEHRKVGKHVPYEEATRIPLVVRLPGVSDSRTSGELAANIDIAPTIARVAGIPFPADGRSLVDTLVNGWHLRDTHAVEAKSGRKRSAFCQVRSKTDVYTRYASGEEEYYRLGRDPLQLKNEADAAGAQDRIRRLRKRGKALCDPTPPGFRW